MKNSFRRFEFIFAILLISNAMTVADDRVDHPTAAADSVVGKLRKNRAEISAQIAALTSAEEKTKTTDTEASSHSETVALLRSLDALYAQHQSLLEQRQQLESQAKQVEKELKLLDRFEPNEPRPYSFLMLDALKDQLAAEEDREQAIEADMKSAKQLLRTAHEELDESESEHQKILGRRSQKDAPTDQELLDAEVATKRARAKISVKQTEIEVRQLRLDICRTKQKQLAKKIKVVKKDVSFTDQDRVREMERLAGKEAALKRRHRESELRLQQVEFQPVLDENDKHPEKKSDTSKESPRDADRENKKSSSSSAEVVSNHRHIIAEVTQAELVLLDQQIENIGDLRRIWKRRYELFHSTPTHKELIRWLDDVDKFRSQIKDLTVSIEHRQDGVRDDQGVITNPGGDQVNSETTTWKDAWHARLQEFRNLCEKCLDDNKSTDRMLNRYRGELKAKIKETASFWGLSLGESWQSLMGYEVTEVDDQSITLGRILVLILAIVVGLFLAYYISRAVSGRLLRALGVHHGTIVAWKSIVFYAMCVVFGVLSFRLLHVPLGAFAFLGGAAAIALGFGSQDIMNNFMSGIILLTEQPIRVGDVIELDDIQGVVTHIGLRSTRILTVSNHELILANKTLLDERVTNLTLSDDFMKAFVTIELDRSVSVKTAKSKMLELVFSHPMVIKSMRPFVLVKEVDCYSIKFEVHFWLQHQGFIKFAIVQSEVLESITNYFEVRDESAVPPTEGDDNEKAAATATLLKNPGNVPEKLLRSQIHKKVALGDGGAQEVSP